MEKVYTSSKTYFHKVENIVAGIKKNILVNVRVLSVYSAFLNERVRRGLETSQPQSWTMESVPHAKQFDSISCGVYVIQVGCVERNTNEHHQSTCGEHLHRKHLIFM